MKTFDFVVVGGGSAGFNAARTARDLGMSVAIVDGAKELGGLCILKGCMPSKALLWSAQVLHLSRKARTFGLKIPHASVDMETLQARKRAIIGEFAAYRQKQLSSDKFTLFRQRSHFISERLLELEDGTKIAGKFFLIATGSKVSRPPIPGFASTPVWTSDDVLDLDRGPKSVIVLGGGVVACELAQFLRRIGSRVVQVQRSPHVLKEFSADASSVVETVFRKEGIELHTHTHLQSISQGADGCFTVRFNDLESGLSRIRRARCLLNALGREPNVDGLGLEKAGVGLTKEGRIAVNRWQQTNWPHIYAGGDVCGPHEIVHLAVAQGELCARHAAGVKGIKPINYDHLLSVAFTDPQVAAIGQRERQLVERGIPFIKASYPFNDHGKSILMDEMHGFVTVLADARRGRVLGAEIVGPDAGELIHCFSMALALKATVHDMLKAPWYHPTLAEILTYPLEEIADQLNI